MCGFVGFVDRSPGAGADALRQVRILADRLVHRGPDDAGAWVDTDMGLAFGFRRLAIVDLTPEGHQPMHSAGGRYVLAFNGEIYNFAAVRRELESGTDAPAFRGRSDTEVMLAAFERWGVEPAVRRFAGMFAFALWDRRDRVLYLCRDRLGEKPLYYGWSGDVLLFGSELKALRAHPRFDGAIDRQALLGYVRAGYVPAPRSIYRSVSKLPPGCLLTLSTFRPGFIPEPVAYWTPEAAASGDWDGGPALRRLETVLGDAVGQQMVADVPLGAFLSGGIDSSLIVALMQQRSRRPVRTFTIGFHEDDFDEARHARAVAHHLGTEHTEFYVTANEAREVLPQLPATYDEPFADSSAIPVLLLARLASQSVTVCLSGDGGDELFAGYRWYGRTLSLWRKLRLAPRPLRRAVSGLLSLPSARAWDRALTALAPLLSSHLRQCVSGSRLHTLAEMLAEADNPRRLHRWLLSKWHACPSLVLGAQAELELPFGDDGCDLVGTLARHDLLTYLPDDILTKVDRATMAASLEARAPFLDHRVVEYALGVPPHLKIRAGRGKWLLRRLLAEYLPTELIERPKMGFSIPLGAWLRGPLREWAEDLLDERRLRREGFFDPAPVRQKWEQHLAGERDWGEHCWYVLMFQAWYAAYKPETPTDEDPRLRVGLVSKHAVAS